MTITRPGAENPLDDLEEIVGTLVAERDPTSRRSSGRRRTTPEGSRTDRSSHTVGEISSRSNPLVKHVRSLQTSRRRRRQYAEFFVEGAQPVAQAFEAGWDVRQLILSPELMSPKARALAERLGGPRQQGVRLSPEIFAHLSDRDSPPGIAAVVASRLTPVAELVVAPDSFFVALEAIASPGNLGTIVRTSNAAGASGVILVGDTVDVFAPVSVRASMGALFSTPISAVKNAAELFAWSEASGVTPLAASGRSTSTHWELECPFPSVLLLGNEGQGLSEGVLSRTDRHVRIPMYGTTESLNVAAAAAVLVYELRRTLNDAGDRR